jgi:hypothetical protein
VQAETNEPENS